MNQQQRPRSIGWNPFLNRVLRLVVSPIPAIATMIPNFPILFNQPDMSSGNKSVEFMIAVSKKPMINHEKNSSDWCVTNATCARWAVRIYA
jgi:hypothetical protein